jgi:phage terminase large subunit-like protein
LAEIHPEFKSLVLETWKKYGLKEEEGWKLPRLCMTDGFFLAKLLGYSEFTDCHREIFGFFVRKNPDALDFKAFAEPYEGSHDDQLMLCRGGFKSTADIVDTIQWIITFPDIRINIMTGTTSLAEEFVELIKGHFQTNNDRSPQIGPDGKPRLFQILFPEHCEPNMGKEPEWVTPARRRAVAGPTVRATSIDKNTTGTHCDVLKVDDGTTAENTNTPTRIASVNKAITQARRLVEPYGFKLRIGTPYDPKDNLASTVADEERRKKNKQQALVKILLRPAYTLAEGYEHLMPSDITDEMVAEGICKLWFPQRITLKFLHQEYADSLKSDPRTFFSQYLLDLSKAHIVKFKREKMIAASLPWQSIPRDGSIFQAWDIAYGLSESADFTVGVTGLIARGQVYVIDVCRGQFDEDTLPSVIAGAAYKWKPSRIAVEDSVGTRWLKKPIKQAMEELAYYQNIEFISLGQGSKDNSKTSRAKPVVHLLGKNRLYFSLEIPDLTYLYDELEAFPPAKGGHDDIVDAISLLVNTFMPAHEMEDAYQSGPLSAPLPPEADGRYRQIYGIDRPRVVEVANSPRIITDSALDELLNP